MNIKNLITTVISAFSLSVLAHDNPASPSLEISNAETLMSKGVWFVKLYSPTCKYSKRLAPHWVKLSQDLAPWAKENDFHFAEVDCKQQGKLCSKLKVDGYPTVNVYHNGEFYKECTTYEGVNELLVCVKEYVAKYKLNTPKQLQVKAKHLKAE